MSGLVEGVGNFFNVLEFDRVRQKSWNLLHVISQGIRPGMTEAQAHAMAKELFFEFDSEKNWHPTKIRFGKNTLKPFREHSELGIVLQENDIFFLDIGPVFDGYEGDVGETFALGDDPEMHKIIQASKDVFKKVKDAWEKDKLSGEELYKFATSAAYELGYILALEGASGHRISDFPHAIHHKGKLKDFDSTPAANRWVLEIHLHHPQHQYGAFFEDILS